MADLPKKLPEKPGPPTPSISGLLRKKTGEFLYRVYASTRLAKMAVTGWGEQQMETFLKTQFEWQHTQYLRNYPAASYNVLLGWAKQGVYHWMSRLHLSLFSSEAAFRWN